MSRSVRDGASVRYGTVSDQATVASSLQERRSHEDHLVIVDPEESPLAVVATAELPGYPGDLLMRDVAFRQPAIVILAAELTITEAAASAAMSALDDEAGMAVIMEADTIVGLWFGESLATARLTAMLGGVRGLETASSDALLPGRIRIPTVVRLCAYRAMGWVCMARREFTELPEQSPVCDDPQALGSHRFGF